MNVELFDTTDVRLEQAIRVRLEVFVAEQRVPLEDEIDEHDGSDDPTAVHAIVREGDVPVAAGRAYLQEPGVVRIGRMAVTKSARGRGVGRDILEALMHDARRRGVRRAVLAAQVHARTFYEKAGFAIAGEEFVEAGIAHIEMARDL
jgi:predicted GNAT family N-acyltransferase